MVLERCGRFRRRRLSNDARDDARAHTHTLHTRREILHQMVHKYLRDMRGASIYGYEEKEPRARTRVAGYATRTSYTRSVRGGT